MKLTIALLLICAALLPGATRLKELATIEGVRENQLVGYGLVVGLNGTGDRRQTIFSAQSLANLLNQMGVSVPPAAIRVNNTASVLVTASLPPYAQPGTRIDITAAAIGDAMNLQGGLLILTSLRGSDGNVYAVGQGPVVTGGFIANGGANNRQIVNHPTVGRVPDGAIVERAAPSVALGRDVRLQLRHADFTTAARVAESINKRFAVAADAAPVARAENSAAISVSAPAGFAARPAEFIAELERLTVEADRVARITINERTGTVVMGREVRISPVAIMHGNLSIQVSTAYEVSQPAPFSQGSTQVVPKVEVGVKEEKARNVLLKEGASVEELVRALSAIGVTPRDVIAVVQSLKSAGALEADIEVI
ncbi:MAG TPA: flagellar basal body P-ring protein FlgI [Bryobacteraceae bacterium]|nr:flagellar basal body P-ring protein FlgI [Bryobacteraceae bacterium]